MVWILVGLGLTWRMIVLLRRWSRRDWEQLIGAPRLHRRPRRHRRPGDRRRRRIAAGKASELLQALAAGRHDPSAHLEAGVVLGPGEVSWGRSKARLWVWSSASAWAWRSRASWWGRRAHGAGRQTVVSGWRDHGDVDWLVTSARLVGRAPGSGELISIWWAGLAGMQVDLHNEVMSLDAANGWRAQLRGPGVAPFGVAGVAGCHGTAALVGHPALASLWDRNGLARSFRREPPAVSPGEPVLRLWSGEPSE